MVYRKVSLAPGEFFHIYNRGNSKQKIFLDDKDRERFVKLLYISNSIKGISFRDDIVDKKIDAWDFEREETLVSIGAWVLMANHFHIYVTSPMSDIGEMGVVESNSRITLFLKKLCVSYSKYFNKKYDRTGALFESTFKSTHIKDDAQAKYLFSYIHLNPVKLIDSGWKENGIKDVSATLKYLDTYKWSSYLDHRGISRNEGKILDLNSFPEYFSNIKDLDSEIFSWLRYA